MRFINVLLTYLLTYLSLFTLRRRVARSANSGHGPGARHDRVRGHCNGTRYVVRQVSRSRYMEAEIACCSSHGYRCRLRLYSRIAERGGVATRKSAKHSLFFVNDFQSVIVVYKEILL